MGQRFLGQVYTQFGPTRCNAHKLRHLSTYFWASPPSDRRMERMERMDRRATLYCHVRRMNTVVMHFPVLCDISSTGLGSTLWCCSWSCFNSNSYSGVGVGVFFYTSRLIKIATVVLHSNGMKCINFRGLKFRVQYQCILFAGGQLMILQVCKRTANDVVLNRCQLITWTNINLLPMDQLMTWCWIGANPLPEPI